MNNFIPTEEQVKLYESDAREILSKLIDSSSVTRNPARTAKDLNELEELIEHKNALQMVYGKTTIKLEDFLKMVEAAGEKVDSEKLQKMPEHETGTVNLKDILEIQEFLTRDVPAEKLRKIQELMIAETKLKDLAGIQKFVRGLDKKIMVGEAEEKSLKDLNLEKLPEIILPQVLWEEVLDMVSIRDIKAQLIWEASLCEALKRDTLAFTASSRESIYTWYEHLVYVEILKRFGIQSGSDQFSRPINFLMRITIPGDTEKRLRLVYENLSLADCKAEEVNCRYPWRKEVGLYQGTTGDRYKPGVKRHA